MRDHDRRDNLMVRNMHRWRMTYSVMDQCQNKKLIPSKILNE